MKTRALFGCLLAALLAVTATANAVVVNTWVQYAPNDTVLLRAIDNTPGANCPTAAVDGAPVTMTPRVSSLPATGNYAYPITMCEASYSAFGHTSATVAGVTLKMPKTNPTRILVIGDTGCRLGSSYPSVQLCDDPQQYPLQYIATYAATFQPDLIIHVGDFFYREYPCPTAQNTSSGCGGSPYLDSWASWNADWFTPAANLMTAAPMALARGNHESCNRGARGWFQFLDTHFVNDPTDLQNAVNCIGTYNIGTQPPGYTGTVTTYVGPYDHTEPYLVHAGSVTLLMFDSSDDNTSAPDLTHRTLATDPYPSMTLPAVYEAQLTILLSTIESAPTQNPNGIFVTHKSTYDIRSSPTNTTQTNGPFSGGDATMQYVFNYLTSGDANTATPNGVPSEIRMLLAGHDHQFEVVNFTNTAFAPQMTQGNSGTLLDNALPTNAPGSTFPPQTTPADAGQSYTLPGLAPNGSTPSITIKNNSDRAEYGFSVWDAVPGQSGNFIVSVYNTSSSKLARCSIQLPNRNIVCVQ